MLGAGEIDSTVVARTDGLDDSRSLGEILVWERAKLFEPLADRCMEVLGRLCDGKFFFTDARLEMAGLLGARRFLLSDLARDSISSFLQINETLFNAYRSFDDEENDDTLDTYPALEVIAIGEPEFQRDWPAAWQRAGGLLYDGRLIAKRDDPVWLALSDFGYPFPPFSFDSLISSRAVLRETAVELAVVGEREKVYPTKCPEGFTVAGFTR